MLTPTLMLTIKNRRTACRVHLDTTTGARAVPGSQRMRRKWKLWVVRSAWACLGRCEPGTARAPVSESRRRLVVVSRCAQLCVLSCVLLVEGCKPAGPKALLQGEKLLERGKYTQ